MVEKLQLLRWFGGKYRLTKYLLPLPEHRLYVEVFGGGASLLLAKEPSYEEIYNDVNGRLINFWKQVQKCPNLLAKKIEDIGLISSRQLFTEYQEISLDPIEDAARFFYVNKNSFSGKMTTFHGISFQHSQDASRIITNQLSLFALVSKRIHYVVIEQQDFRKLIPRLDDPRVCLYLDPPYYQGGDNYEDIKGGKEWNQQCFDDLHEIVTHLQHAKWIMSIDQIKGYEQYHIQEIERINSADSGKEKKREIEYIIRNFDPEKTINQKHQNVKILGDY
jgi:DNA adenine methylase